MSAAWGFVVVMAAWAGGLEVEVANLWPNRLIGDAGLEPPERKSWTTWNPYRPNDPLLPSGLLGPVTLRRTIAP